ncbi:MAG: hypothetical protein AABX89_00905 [Candidatus Thermoplasmatota archaeon]
MRTLRLQLTPAGRITWSLLNVLPLPGLGALWVGWRNPHSRLLRHGWLQMVLVVFGSWPLLVPGAIGFGWAIFDAVRIGQADLAPLPPKAQAQEPA